MKRNAAILIAGLLIGAVVVIGAIVLIFNAMQPTPTPNNNQNTTPPAQNDSQTGVTEVIIKNRAYSPKSITVKKGTTVRWVNQDVMEHNVVSDNDAPLGGPPKQAPLLGKDQVFEFTYNTVGTFDYHCTPHPDMTGTIEVIE